MCGGLIESRRRYVICGIKYATEVLSGDLPFREVLPNELNPIAMKMIKSTHLGVLFTLALALPTTMAAESETKDAKAAESAASPSATSIAGVLKSGATFSILSKAIEAAGITELGEKGTYTVFAPTDDAFMKLPKGALDKLLLPENKEKLRSLLLYHVVAGDFLSSGLKDEKIKAVNGELLKIKVDGKKIEVDDSKVVNADVKADNGTIHVVDKVIVPKSLDGFVGLDAD